MPSKLVSGLRIVLAPSAIVASSTARIVWLFEPGTLSDPPRLLRLTEMSILFYSPCVFCSICVKYNNEFVKRETVSCDINL